ncbi:hypothetical protein U9M48_045086 [Paspalum notatum var. saurae]|uniref:Uncharacterized protein n=1 Tax=Paspalum notatum var. saurae TaxID=547442 RepID=A0AAQ3V0L4_PASNO
MEDDSDDQWEDESFLEQVFSTAAAAEASRNPNPTPTPTPAPAPIPNPTYDHLSAATPITFHLSASVSYLPAASCPSPAPCFSPPPELSQPPPLAAAGADDDLSFSPRTGSPSAHRPRMSAQRSKREREAREVERLKRELSRVSTQVNHLVRAFYYHRWIDTDQSFHAPANGNLHAGNSSGASTRRADMMNGKDKDAHSLRDSMYLKQGHRNDIPEALESRHPTMMDNAHLEENNHFEPRSITCKEIKAMGVQTDSTSDSERLECNKVLVERISRNLRATWGPNSLSRRNLISKIVVSCSEGILSLLQCTRLSDNCETSSEASSSMNEAISQVYDMFIKMNSEKIPIQTFLEALLNLCAFDNVSIVSGTLRVLLRILQHLLTYGIKPSERNNVSVDILMENSYKDSSALLSPADAENSWRQHNNMSLPFTFWSSVFTVMLQVGVKYSEETIRTDALSIMILIVRATDPKEERQRFGFTSVMTRLHLLLQKENGLLVKKHSVRLLFLLLNCPVMLKLLCSGGKDGSEQMELEGFENDRSQEVISSVLVDFFDCLTSDATCSLTRMANDLAELAQKFRSRVYAFLEEKPLTVDGNNLSVSRKR